MTILLCTSEIGNEAGGLALHCLQLKEIYEKLGHKVYVEILFEFDDYSVVDGGYDENLGDKIRYAHKIEELSKKYKDLVDICISCGAGKTAYYAMLFCKKVNIPLDIVLCGSEINISWNSIELTFYNKEALKYAKAIIGISNELISNAQIINENKLCKYYIIPIACKKVEQSKYKYKKEKKKEKERIVFASGASFLGEKKGIANLLIVFSKLIHNKKRDDYLFLYGKIDSDIKEKYQSIIRNNNLQNNVFLCGYLERDEFIKRMQLVDVYIQASPFEGFGISVVESIAIGKDILISDTGYVAEQIRTKYPEHIIHSLNPELMVNEIINYINNEYPKGENEKIRKFMISELSETKIISEWKKVFENYAIRSIETDEEFCTTVMFHDVDSMYSGVDYAKDGFGKLVNLLYMNGYKLCSVRDYFSEKNRSKKIICTFDDGYENVYRNALPVLQEYNLTATVYVCPDLIGKDNSWNHRDEVNRKHLSHEMIIELVEAGWEIGSHGLSHMNMIRLSDHELDTCLAESKKQLEIYGIIESFCYPYGVFNLFIKEKVKKYYSNAFSVTVGGTNYMNDPYQITRVTPEELITRLNI